MCLRATEILLLSKIVVVAEMAITAVMVVFRIVLVVSKIVVLGVVIILSVVVVTSVVTTITTEVEGLETGSPDLFAHLVQQIIAILTKDRRRWILVWCKMPKM